MRLALGIEYDGSQLYGWQRQKQVVSVQAHLEQALSNIAAQPITVSCAGRTDAGVHATGQVVHFESPVTRPDRAWTLGTNNKLPDSIAVKWVKPVPDDFHARFSATARRYRYVIYNNKTRAAILYGGVTHVHKALDHEKMHEAAQALVGEHDFSTFRASLCQAKSPRRHIMHIRVRRHSEYIVIDVKANAFLHHMVRNITGSLIAVGSSEQPTSWIAWLLAQKDRTLAAATAKPNGLYLVEVTYPERFALPKIHTGPLFLLDD